MKFSASPPPPCFFIFSPTAHGISYLAASLSFATPTLFHSVFWTLYSCQMLQSKFSSSHTTLSVFLQTSHFPTISFPFSIPDSYVQSQHFLLSGSPWIFSLFAMLPLWSDNLLNVSLVCALCFPFTLHTGKHDVPPKAEVIHVVQQLSTEHEIYIRHVLRNTKMEYSTVLPAFTEYGHRLTNYSHAWW